VGQLGIHLALVVLEEPDRSEQEVPVESFVFKAASSMELRLESDPDLDFMLALSFYCHLFR